MAKAWRMGLLAALWVAAGVPGVEAATRLKLGTLAPVGTSYHKSLMAMGEAWRKDSAGAVELNVFAGGKLGGEMEMVGLMKVNSLQAAMLTAVGLAEIEPAVAGLQNIPMGFRSFAEVDYVGEKLQPMLEERLAAKGFVVMFWSDAGWVRLFSNKPVQQPDDLRALKLFTWSGNPAQVEVYKSGGFNAVPIETADIVPSLQTKLIDAVPVPPFFAMASQVDTRAPHMLELDSGAAGRGCGGAEGDLGQASRSGADGIEEDRPRHGPGHQGGGAQGDGRFGGGDGEAGAQGHGRAAGDRGGMAPGVGVGLSQDPGQGRAGGGVRPDLEAHCGVPRGAPELSRVVSHRAAESRGPRNRPICRRGGACCGGARTASWCWRWAP